MYTSVTKLIPKGKHYILYYHVFATVYMIFFYCTCNYGFLMLQTKGLPQFKMTNGIQEHRKYIYKYILKISKN